MRKLTCMIIAAVFAQAVAAGRPALAGEDVELEPGSQMRLVASIERLRDDLALVAVPITPEQEKALARLGYERVTSPSETDHRTIHGGNVYLEYPVLSAALIRKLGNAGAKQCLELELRRDARGHPLIVGIRY